MGGTRLSISRLLVRLVRNSPKVDAGKSRPFSSPAPQVLVSKYKKSDSASEHIASNNILHKPQHAETTALVDDLVQYTRELMDGPRRNKQIGDIDEHDMHIRHVVAFSGGIDSSLVLALLKEASDIGPQANESVYAVIGRSSALPQDQLNLARHVAEHIGIPLQEVDTTEGTDETYIANNGQACLACKTHLYSALQAVAEHAMASNTYQNNGNPQQHNSEVLLYNGTNADDVQDTTRVGLVAARNFQVQSPLL